MSSLSQLLISAQPNRPCDPRQLDHSGPKSGIARFFSSRRGISRWGCTLIVIAAGLSIATATGQAVQDSVGQSTMNVVEDDYGTTATGQEVKKFTCRNKNGVEMQLISYGATMTSLMLPDRDGKMANVILSCPDLAGYEKCQSYFGCIAGRYCNRIAGGKFELDGQTYQLATNNGPNHLHGGVVGFDKQVWDAEVIEEDFAVGVRFTLTSPDGDEGYPGTVTATAEYRLTNDNQLTIDCLAITDAPSPVNLTNHNYWNFAGEGNILQHVLMINADRYLPVDDTMIPTGELAKVDGTALDFREPTAIGDRIDDLRDSAAKGYDHCFALNSGDEPLVHAATIADPSSGRQMEIWTNQPGLQFYSGNFLDGSEGSGGFTENRALCLETQFYPDSPNQPSFPSSILRPDDTYHHQVIYRFSTIDGDESAESSDE